MGGLKENINACLIEGASNFQDDVRLGGSKQTMEVVQNPRRALSVINQNIWGATIRSNAINKKGLGNGVAHKPNPGLAEAVIGDVEETRDDHTVIDVEDCGDDDGAAVPMFVRHTEAFLDEIDRMDVDELEVTEDPILDIDGRDLKNPLAVVEYVDDIYAYYRKIEISSCVSPTYMDHQSDINEKMRAILIDWLLEVHYKFELMDETLFLTINIVDKFLERQVVVRKKLQLVGVTAMLLACKYEEVSVPIVDDFILISDNAYTRKEVLDMEKLLLNTLQFNMSVPTPYVFMRRFLKAAQSDKKLELLAFFIVELCLVEYKMLKFPPSLLAAAAIYTAQCSLYQLKQWTKTSEWLTNYPEDQLLECSRLMVTLHEKAATGKLTGVYRKFNTSKFGHAAKAEPALFLLNNQ
ncbi:Cyclin-B2-3 [Citrus sinensis]|nr:G2/mitotic-specific cyclin-2 [Citrus x clementina]XP_006486609.2 G2/mitotic-specific cyclin-2 [Citrus sinensis]KAH9654832.1 Cyclin-B2-3 [Citrus sinensis]